MLGEGKPTEALRTGKHFLSAEPPQQRPACCPEAHLAAGCAEAGIAGLLGTSVEEEALGCGVKRGACLKQSCGPGVTGGLSVGHPGSSPEADAPINPLPSPGLC